MNCVLVWPQKTRVPSTYLSLLHKDPFMCPGLQSFLQLQSFASFFSGHMLCCTVGCFVTIINLLLNFLHYSFHFSALKLAVIRKKKTCTFCVCHPFQREGLEDNNFSLLSTLVTLIATVKENDSKAKILSKFEQKEDSIQKPGMGAARITASIDSLILSFEIFKQAFINCLLSIRASFWYFLPFISAFIFCFSVKTFYPTV